MQTLVRANETAEAPYYAIRGEFDDRVRRYVVSTAPSRAICNRPEILGVRFSEDLVDAMTLALRHAPFRELVAGHPEERVCVVHFLRGGLNFGLRRALHAAYGFNRHSSAFMSSQRRRVEGRWEVREDIYRKLQIPPEAVLVMGDVVATGVTVGNGLDVIVDHVQAIGSSLRGIVFFTFGCHKVEKVLARIDARLRDAFPGYRETVVVYLEGKFRLVDDHTNITLGIPGTDLLRRHAVLAPEFELSQYDALSHPLERCTIYDAGSRAFDIPSYVDDILEYWQGVAALAGGGRSLVSAMEERFPAGPSDRRAFLDDVATRCADADAELVERLYEGHAARWDRLRSSGGSADALAELSAQRVATLQTAGGPQPADDDSEVGT